MSNWIHIVVSTLFQVGFWVNKIRFYVLLLRYWKDKSRTLTWLVCLSGKTIAIGKVLKLVAERDWRRGRLPYTESWWWEGSGRARSLTRPLQLSAATAPSLSWPPLLRARDQLQKHDKTHIHTHDRRKEKKTHAKRKKNVFKANDKPRWSPHESSFLILRAQLCCFWVSPPST